MEYLNPWHDPKYQGSKQYYETDGYPLTEYNGYLISKRSNDEYHLIFDSVCVGMNAGPRGARDRIDRLIKENHGNQQTGNTKATC